MADASIRAVYDLYGTPFSDFDDSGETDRGIRREIQATDNITINESKKLYTISKNTSQRLKKFNGITGEHLYHPPSLVGRYYNSDMNDYILSVGRLESLKRIELLIEALAKTKSPVRCIIAGKGHLESTLMKAAASYGIAERVRFTGFVTDEELLNLYANCLAVYYAPFDEDYGYVTLELFSPKNQL